MDRYDLALIGFGLIGFGGVNRALAELIVQRGDDLARELGFTLRVVAITDLRTGSLVDTDGIDLVPLLATEPDALSNTVLVTKCTNIEFDRVNIRGGTNAIRLEAKENERNERNERIIIHDCEIDGGLPTWYFRSDRKDEYSFVPATLRNATEDDFLHNPLGKATSNTVPSSRRNAFGIELHHCELVNGHDVCLFGLSMRFHHNWVNNINDDALFMGSEDAATDDAWIYRSLKP